MGLYQFESHYESDSMLHLKYIVILNYSPILEQDPTNFPFPYMLTTYAKYVYEVWLCNGFSYISSTA